MCLGENELRLYLKLLEFSCNQGARMSHQNFLLLVSWECLTDLFLGPSPDSLTEKGVGWKLDAWLRGTWRWRTVEPSHSSKDRTKMTKATRHHNICAYVSKHTHAKQTNPQIKTYSWEFWQSSVRECEWAPSIFASYTDYTGSTRE